MIRAASELMHGIRAHFVEHQPHQAIVVEAVARLLSLEPTRFLTGEGALAAAPPDVLLTDLILPGRDGLSLIRATKERAPKSFCVLLSSVVPGLAPGAAERFGVDVTIVRRGAWGHALAEHAGTIADAEAEQLLTAIELGDAGFAPLVEMIASGRLSLARESLALQVLAAAFDPDRVAHALSTIARPAVHEVALDVAIALGAPGFGIASELATSPSALPPLRARAMRHLARCFPHGAVMPVLQANLQDPSPLIRLDAAHAAFDSASRIGEQGLTTMREIADAGDLPDDLRIAALEHVARDLPRPLAKSFLIRALESDHPAIVQAASTLAMKGDGVDVEALAGAASAGALADRLAALDRLARDFPKQDVLPILARFQLSPDAVIRRRAYELAMSRADTGFEATLFRAAAEGPAMLQAGLHGAAALGTAGFAAIAAIASLEAADLETRTMAIRLLGVRFGAPAAPILTDLALTPRFELAAAALTAAVHLRAAGFAILKTGQHSAIPAIRELALIHLEEHAPDPVFKPALQRALRDPDRAVRCRAIELWMKRLGADCAPLLDRLAKSGDEALQHAGLDGALSLGEGGYAATLAFATRDDFHANVSERAAAVLGQDFHRKPERREDPIKNILPAVPASCEKSDPSAPTEPAAPASETSRARKALEAAILQGADGYRAIRALAESAPDDVRIQALRRLADFPDRGARSVLEAALFDRSHVIRSVALGSLMLRKDARFESIAALARDEAADELLRVRAVRFLASRFEQERVRPLLEELFEAADRRVRRAALECRFTSLKFVHPDRIEEHLTNLMTRHESPEVRAAAAKALNAIR